MSDTVTISRPRFERMLRVVMLAKDADAAERRASLELDPFKKPMLIVLAYRALIDMGQALDDLEPEDLKNVDSGSL